MRQAVVAPLAGGDHAAIKPEDDAEFLAVEGDLFGINFIPHTKEVTNWGDVAVGDRANLEIDTLARYVARLAEAG